MIKLHIGCGRRDFGKDWVHIDGEDLPHIAYHDITKLAFEDDTVDLIYACHVIEYFDREEIISVLEEWKRALKTGATLRLAVPDFRMLAFAYYQGYELADILGPLFGKMKMGDKTIYHKTVYDRRDLSQTLTIAGFKEINIYNWRNTEHIDFDDHSRAHLPHDPEAIRTGIFTENHIPISLNVECIK